MAGQILNSLPEFQVPLLQAVVVISCLMKGTLRGLMLSLNKGKLNVVKVGVEGLGSGAMGRSQRCRCYCKESEG
jgi:hypothetical protein